MTLRNWAEHILTHDFSPWANRYVYWLKSPLGLLVVAAMVALLCGLFVATQGLVVFVAITVVIAVGIVWPWLGLRGIECEISFGGRRVRENESVPVVVTIVNRWPLPVWGLAIEKGFFIKADPEADETAVALAQIGPWSKTNFEWQFTPECRGVYPKESPLISTGFPFGLWQSSRPITARDELLVWPRTFELDAAVLPPGRQFCVATASDQRAGTDGETIGARPYRLGDTLRSVHWALTARYDRFIVRERQDSAQSKAVLLVETSPELHTRLDCDSTLEWSIRIAASAAEALLKQGAVVRMVIGERQLEAHPGSSGLRQVLDLLARFDAEHWAVLPPISRGFGNQGEADFNIVITTDRAAIPTRAAKRILLNTAAFEERDGFVLHDLQPRKAWIEVDDPRSVPTQVARQWRTRRQEVFRGV